MYDILAIQKCFNSASSSEEVYENPIERLRRGKLDVNDMFMPVRGRRTKPTSDIVAEKKAPLDVLKNDLFMPNRGRRDFPDIIRPSDYFNMKRNGIDLNSKDYFMPNRGRREQSIDSLLSENFFPQRGKKSTSDMILEVPWLVPNRPRPPVDRNMIDLLRDLNQIMNEVRNVNSQIPNTIPYSIQMAAGRLQKLHEKSQQALFINVNSLSSAWEMANEKNVKWINSKGSTERREKERDKIERFCTLSKVFFLLCCNLWNAFALFSSSTHFLIFQSAIFYNCTTLHPRVRFETMQISRRSFFSLLIAKNGFHSWCRLRKMRWWGKRRVARQKILLI